LKFFFQGFLFLYFATGLVLEAISEIKMPEGIRDVSMTTIAFPFESWYRPIEVLQHFLDLEADIQQYSTLMFLHLKHVQLLKLLQYIRHFMPIFLCLFVTY
jgi:hypothetical protein